MWSLWGGFRVVIELEAMFQFIALILLVKSSVSEDPDELWSVSARLLWRSDREGLELISDSAAGERELLISVR